MKNRPIQSYKYCAVVWGNYLVETFRILRISDNKVIRNSHIGRGTYYQMKKEKQINSGAYLRLTRFALKQIRERELSQHPPQLSEKDWKEGFWTIIIEGQSPGCGEIPLFLS